MSSIILNSTEMQIIYIDPNVPYINNTQVEGTGATPSDPLFNLPSNASSYPSNVLFLVRRSANNYSAVIPRIDVPNVTNLVIWGMPICPYQPTTDTKFEAGTTYYTRNNNGADIVFTQASVTDGATIPVDTYYELTGSDSAELWELIPYAAKVAWFDAVTTNNTQLNTQFAYNANILHTSNANGLICANCRYLELKNVSFNTTIDSSSSNYAIVCSQSSGIGCAFKADHVWFRSVSSISDGIPAFWTNGVPLASRYYGGRWVFINENSSTSATAAVITNSKIDCSGSFTSGSRGNIHLGYCDTVLIENTNINILQGSSAPVFYVTGSDPVNTKVVVNNVHAKYYYYDKASSTTISAILEGSMLTLTMTNCSLTKSEVQYWSPYNSKYTEFKGLVAVYVASAGSEISDINIEYPDVSGQTSKGIVVRYNPNIDDSASGQVSQYTKLHTINITCANDNAPIYKETNHHNYRNLYESYGDEALIRCIRDGSEIIPSSDFLLQDITIDAPYGRAMNLNTSLLDLNAKTIRGGVRLRNCMGKIGTLSHFRPGNVLYDDGVNTLYIGNIICDRTGKMFEYTGDSAIYTNRWTSNILVGNCNTEFTSNVANTDTLYKCSYICTNNASFNGNGNYCVRTQRAFCKTWNIARVGSDSGCSLKLFNESASDANYPLLIGGAPFKGITKHVTQGRHKVTIYAMTNGYTYPENIINNLTIKMHANNSIFTSVQGQWSEDTTSEWTNIESGSAKAYKFELTFTANEEQDVEFEYAFSWFMVGGAVYLDPHPIIE